MHLNYGVILLDCLVNLRLVYTEQQYLLCDDISNAGLTENYRVTTEWVTTTFWSDSIVVNESSIANVITVLPLTLRVNGPLL